MEDVKRRDKNEICVEGFEESVVNGVQATAVQDANSITDRSGADVLSNGQIATVQLDLDQYFHFERFVSLHVSEVGQRESSN